jgi:hypothetical protein
LVEQPAIARDFQVVGYAKRWFQEKGADVRQ